MCKCSRKRKFSSIENFILHLHPNKIDERAIKFSRTFGLGGICALLFVLLAFTGIILRFSYVPTVEHAYESIVNLQRNSIFGEFIRNLHHLSAKLLMVVSFLHILRVYYSQSIFKKRAENWIYGLVLMFLIAASSFTGYLLPWDQLSYWAVTVFTQIIEYIPWVGHHLADFIRSGDSVNGNTLLNFYNLHTGIIPLLFVVLMSVHFWLVRKAGGVALSKVEEKHKVPVIPNLVAKEIMVASVIIAGVFLTSVFYHTPLLSQANSTLSPNPSKAPWYFLGAQELLLHIHPVFSAVIIPVALGFYMLYLPYFKYKNLNESVWFNSELGKQITIQSAILSFVFTFILIYLFEYFLHFEQWMSGLPTWISTGVVPMLLYLFPIGGYLMCWYKRHKANNVELIMAITTILISSYLTMMLISFFLRGEGMKLIF